MTGKLRTWTRLALFAGGASLLVATAGCGGWPPAVAAALASSGKPASSAASGAAEEDLLAGNTRLWKQSGRELATGALVEVSLTPDEGSLQLARSAPESYAGQGFVVSAEHRAEFPFDNAVLSWNADAPPATELRFDLRVRAGDKWSAWYTMGRWGAEGGASVPGQRDRWGRVDVDTLKLASPAEALQYRVVFTTTDPAATPTLRMLAVAYAARLRTLSGTVAQRADSWVRELPVPVHSQLLEDSAIAREICSPTSLAMVLEYWGVQKPVAEVAAGVRDQSAGIYGNWPLNTAYAGAQGFESYVDRFFRMEQLEAEIAAGRPVVLSLRYKLGELDAAYLRATSGHLIVARGFTPDGDVVVNDPFAPDDRSVGRVYGRQQLAKAWLGHGGIVYIVKPRGA